MIETYKIITRKEKVNPEKFFQMLPDPESEGPRTRVKKSTRNLQKRCKKVLLYHESHKWMEWSYK